MDIIQHKKLVITCGILGLLVATTLVGCKTQPTAVETSAPAIEVVKPTEATTEASTESAIGETLNIGSYTPEEESSIAAEMEEIEMNTSIDVRTGEVFEVPTDAPVEDLKIQDVSIPDFQAETLEMLKSDWDACRVTQKEVEEVYFVDDLMLSEAGKEEMRQYMIDHPQVKETQAPVKETKPVETQAPVNNAPQETLSAEEKAELGLVDADEFFSSMDDDTGMGAPGGGPRDEQLDWIK